jgi:hypothetical protein
MATSFPKPPTPGVSPTHGFVNLKNFDGIYFILGPSGVRALPLGRTKCTLFLELFFVFLSLAPHTFLPEGVVLGL